MQVDVVLARSVGFRATILTVFQAAGAKLH